MLGGCLRRASDGGAGSIDIRSRATLAAQTPMTKSIKSPRNWRLFAERIFENKGCLEKRSTQRCVFDFPFLTDALQHPVLGGGSNVRSLFGAVRSGSCNDATEDFDGDCQLVAIDFCFAGNFIATLRVVFAVFRSRSVNERGGEHFGIASDIAETQDACKCVLLKGCFWWSRGSTADAGEQRQNREQFD